MYILVFFSRPLPKAGHELQTELNTIDGGREGGMTLSKKPAGGSESTIILTVGNIDGWQYQQLAISTVGNIDS